MKTKVFMAVAAAMVLLSSCDILTTEQGNPRKALQLSTKSGELLEKGNGFSFKFLSAVNDSANTDYVISPLSMQFLLGMILNGAKGETATEICNVLCSGAGEVDAVNSFCLSMLQQLPKLDKKTKLSIANAIFVDAGYQLNAPYKSTVSKHYLAEVSNLDFSKTKESTDHINNWCSKNTNGMIPKVLDEVSPDMLAYLLDALYFKSEWTRKFKKEMTKETYFTGEDGSKSTVSMMRNMAHFLYTETKVLRAVDMPYGNGAYSMTALLPQQGYKLSDVVKELENSDWNTLRASMDSCNVDLWIPKFETSFHINLNGLLSEMGMPRSFSLGADFSAMSPDAARLSFVQQDAVIKVDEEGAEAAAVSSAGMEKNSAGPPDPFKYVVFHADRPFIYLITEHDTGAVLFAGRYSAKPQPKK